VGIFERQRLAMEAEIIALRATNAQLCHELCEKENLVYNNSKPTTTLVEEEENNRNQTSSKSPGPDKKETQHDWQVPFFILLETSNWVIISYVLFALCFFFPQFSDVVASSKKASISRKI
jgi:hypothetical protein